MDLLPFLLTFSALLALIHACKSRTERDGGWNVFLDGSAL